MAANPVAVVVQLANLDDNTDPARVAALDAATRQWLTRKYTHARPVLTTLPGAADVADPDDSAGPVGFGGGPGPAAAGV